MDAPPDSLDPVVALVRQGRLPEARAAVGRYLVEEPADAEALHLAGMIELVSGDPAAAVPFLRRSVEAQPAVPFAWSNLGVAFNGIRDFAAALRCFEKTLELQPGNAAALKNQGIALRHLGRHEDAMASFRRAAQREPNDTQLHREVGDLLVDMGRFEEALPRYSRAIAGNPRDASSLQNRGFAAWRAGRLDEAAQDLRRAIELAPDFARAHANLGGVLGDLDLATAAAEHCARAVALDPADARNHNALGLALHRLERTEEAIASLDRALEIDPDLVEALVNRGAARHELRREAEALADYERANELDRGLRYNLGDRLIIKMTLCDWSGYDELLGLIVSRLQAGHLASQPFPLLGVPVTAPLLARCAELYGADLLRRVPIAPRAARFAHERLRIGYFASEFQDHPVGHLVAPLAEAHDRSRVEITAFSSGPATGDPVRARLEAAFDRFEDVRSLSDAEVAALAREREIDIAIDLNGYSGKSRVAVFARGAAPVQAQFMGYAGTMGTRCIDYLIADSTAIPREHREWYAEKIVALPDPSLVAEAGRPIAATPARAALGLPDRAFVFCCFCNRYKITPDLFAAWMRILRQVEGSVLWLARSVDTASANLHAQAERSGVAPERLVFAERVPDLAEHFGRLGAADLFLDTWYYNGHVTTSDALYAGLPVLACLGETFAARVSSSLLRAAGLPELIAESPAEYEALALGLARDPAALRALRARLRPGQGTLFDVARLARDLERAFHRMDERRRAGLAPDHIELEPGER